MKRSGFCFFALFFVIFIAFSCTTTDAPVEKPDISEENPPISKDDAASTAPQLTILPELAQTTEELTVPTTDTQDFDLDEAVFDWDEPVFAHEPEEVIDPLIEVNDNIEIAPPIAESTPTPQATTPAPTPSPTIPTTAAPTPTPTPPPFLRPAEQAAVVQPTPEAIVQAPVLPARIPATETSSAVTPEVSRTSRAITGQIVEIPFRGMSWVYLGEAASQRGMAYDSRRIDNDGQTFIFRAEKEGTYTLQFHKQDFLQDYLLNDRVQIIVSSPEDAAKNRTLFSTGGALEQNRVIAGPRWPPSAGLQNVTQSADIKTISPENSTAKTEPVISQAPTTNDTNGALEQVETDNKQTEPATTAAEYTERGRQLLKDGQYAQAINAIDDLMQQYPYSADDEAWWIYGQSFEAPGSARNIQSALDAYRHITREYPQSRYYDSAKDRIAYLNKFYFNIR